MKRKRFLLLMIVLVFAIVAGCAKKEENLSGKFPKKDNFVEKTDESEKEEEEEKDNSERMDASEEKRDYILPDSDTKLLTEDDLEGLSMKKLRLARNEIFARHGRRFNTEYIQKYFDSRSWYDGQIAPEQFDESILNTIEKQNANFILAYEKNKENENQNANRKQDIPSSDSMTADNRNMDPSGSNTGTPSVDEGAWDDSGSGNASGTNGASNSTAGNYQRELCPVCHGSGISCFSCASGKCFTCFGKGTSICGECGGSGDCSRCTGLGFQGVDLVYGGKITCVKCHGLAICKKCNGTGKGVCNSCRGSGLCRSCYGHYQCAACNGLGYYY